MLTLLRHRRKSLRAAAAADYRSTVLADNPLFYYRLGESSGSTAYDEVAASSNGTYYNTPTLGQTGGISGDSDTTVLFEQANSEYATTTTLSSVTSLLPCTIECFVKCSGASDSNGGIVFIRGTTPASGLNIRGNTLGKLGYHWRDQSNTYGYTGGPTLSDNTWYYVALVVTSTEATFYVIDESGTLTTATNSVTHSAINPSTNPWHIARDSGYTDRYFQGYIDEVAIYDQALSQSTVVAHAAAAGYAAAAPITLEDSAVTTGVDYSAPVDISVNIPAVSTNDIMLLLSTSDSISNPTTSPPAGWTKIVEQDGTTVSISTVAAYWKRASSSASATTELWSAFYPDSGEIYYIWVGAYSGCVTSGSPVDAYGSAAAGFSTPWSVNVTTTTADTMIVTISGNTNANITHTWSDGTELIDTAYMDAAVSINEKLESTTGSKTRTVTPSVAGAYSMAAVALRSAPTNDNFEFTVATTTSNETFTIPCIDNGTFDAVVDWGDSSTSTITAYNDADLAHTYSSAGTHSISISGTFGNIRFVNSSDKTKVRTVTNLGSVGWTRFNAAFQGCTGLTSFTAGDCDTSSVTNWQRMFRQCTGMTTCNMDGMSTASATKLHSMFYDCSSLTAIDCSGFDVSNVTNFGYGMFYNCNSATSISVSNWNVTSGTTYFAGMFQDCQSVTSLDLSGWDTSGVTSMQNMFLNCYDADIDITGWTSVGVTDMNYFIYRVNQSSNTIVGLSGLNVESIAATPTDFADGVTLSTAEYDSILIAWSAQTVVSGQTWDFGSSQYTANSTAATARADLVTAGWTITDGGSIANNNFEFTVTTTTASETFTIPCQNAGTFNATVDWGDGSTSTITTYNDADLVHTYTTAGDHDISISGTFPNIYFNNGGDKTKVKSVTNLGSVGWVSFDRAFRGCSNMTSFTAGDSVTSGVSTIQQMFAECSNLATLDLTEFDTSGVTNMREVFYLCGSLTSADLSSFDTTSVTSAMDNFFRNCSSMTSVDVTSFDTSGVTNMLSMFRGCSSLTSLDVSSFDTSGVTNMGHMFRDCSSASGSITGPGGFDITSVNTDSMDSMFYGTSLSTSTYDSLLVNWEAQSGYNNQNPNFGSSTYTAGSAAATARADLVTSGWSITDGGTA